MYKDPSELCYYLTVFKLKGHTTYRATLHQKKDNFNENVAKHTDITEKKVYRIDRITSEIKEI